MPCTSCLFFIVILEELLKDQGRVHQQQHQNGYSNGYKNSSPKKVNGLENGNVDKETVASRLGRYSGKTPLPQNIEKMKKQVIACL